MLLCIIFFIKKSSKKLNWQRHIFLIRVVFPEYILIFVKYRYVCLTVFYIDEIEHVSTLFPVVREPPEDDEYRADKFEYDPVVDGEVLIEHHKSPHRIERDECKEEYGCSREENDRVVREDGRHSGLTRVLGLIGEEQEGHDDEQEEDNISAVAHLETEGIVLDRKSVV